MSDQFYAEPVIGYRSWTVCAKTHRLRSRIIREMFWSPEERCSAYCSTETQFRLKTDDNLPELHEAPQIGCSCGIYGFHELYDAIDRYGSGENTLVGSCAYWGKIVVCTAGFRAQHARIVALTDHRKGDRPDYLGWSALIERVIEKYNVPLLPVDVLEDYTNTWGKPLAL